MTKNKKICVLCQKGEFTLAPCPHIKTKGEKISFAAKIRKENRLAQLIFSIEGNRVYISSVGNNAVSVKIDITPVWHFFNEVKDYQVNKKNAKRSNTK